MTSSHSIRNNNTKAQIWYADFIIGVLIFIVVLVVFFVQLSNIEEKESSKINELLVEASRLSDSLLSSGSPDNWNKDDVIRIGVTNNNQRINETKWEELTLMNYSEIRSRLRAKKEFFFFLEDQTSCLIEINEKYGIGSPKVEVNEQPCTEQDNIDLTQANPKNIIQISRIIIYNSEANKLVTYVWQ